MKQAEFNATINDVAKLAIGSIILHPMRVESLPELRATPAGASAGAAQQCAF